MARPTNKEELLHTATLQYTKLMQLITTMEEEQLLDFKILPEGKEAHWMRDNNIRDVLIHLYEWHQLLLHWVEKQQRGENVPFLPAPYSWTTYGKMNQEFWKKHQSTSYLDAKEMLHNSHHEVLKLISSFSNEELFTKKHFSWTGTSSLGQYCISTTSSHYDWAIKKLRKIRKINA